MIAIMMPEMAEFKRVQFGARLEAQYKSRINAVAKKKKTTARSILEQILESKLPELERDAGIVPESSATGPQDPKADKGR